MFCNMNYRLCPSLEKKILWFETLPIFINFISNEISETQILKSIEILYK